MNRYTLHADESLLKKVPLWAWVLLAIGGVVIIAGLLRGRRADQGELEEYLR